MVGVAVNTGWYAALGGNDSFPTQAWRLTYDSYIQNSRNLVQTSGSFRAPIFYDLNNTGYYLNPASTSYWNVSQQGGYHTFLNYGVGVTGTYTSTRLQLVFAMGAAYRPNSAGSSAANMYGIGWSHPNAGGLGGANQLNDHGMLIINNGSFRAAISGRAVFSVDVRAPLFYDWNNTGYYVDPASSSQMSSVYANNWFRPTGGTGLYFQSYGYGIFAAGAGGNPYGNMTTYGSGAGGWSGIGISRKWTMMSSGTGNSNNFGIHNTDSSWLWYWNGSYTNTRLGYLNNESSMRAPIFYDTDNTGYYMNPASESNWQGLTARGQAMIGLTGNNRSGALGNYGRRPNITGDTNYWTGSKGWGTVDMNTVGNWGSGFFDTWSNPANQPSGTSHWVGVQAYHYSNGSARYGWQLAGGPITNLRFRSSWSGFRAWRTIPVLDENSTNGGAMYAGRYYDSNSTGYYGDFASTSVMNVLDIRGEIYNDGWFRNDNGGRGLYSSPYGRHFYAAGTSYWHLDGGSSSGGLIIYDRYNASQGSSTGRRGYLYYDASGFGLLHSAGGWAFRAVNGSSEVYGTLYANSIQANIVYDRNNTAYYFDGASINSTRFEGVSNKTRAMFGNSGQTQGSAEYYSARPRITGDVRYWTGSKGWGRIDMNQVATWGSGAIDSWSNPANQPSGTSHWVGMQAFHGNFSNTQNYGWQMVGGPITNLRFRSSWSGWRSWRTIPVLDENSGNGGSMYAGRYYDSNNTGYYSDPASYSNHNEGNFAGRMWFSNYVVSRGNGGMMGSYNATSTAAKVIWTIGESWPIGNMYGLAYEYNGSYGHHLALKNNGTTYHRISFSSQGASMSGTWQASSSLRAPIFYDSNNTSYYTDPGSSGTALRIAGDILCDANYGKGLVGVYASTRYQHVWSMGAAYRTNASGTSYGNMYGLTYTHTNVGTGSNQSISGLSHQLQGRANGGLWWALGSGIWTTGNITAYSDISVKTNLERIPNALEKICSINGYTYDRTDYVRDEATGIMPETRQAGVVAQEVEKILPEVVTGTEGNKSVAYGNMVALTIEAIKEQQNIINNQQQQINDLKDMVSELIKKLS